MEIQEIKESLTLSHVLKYYNLKPDKQLRLNPNPKFLGNKNLGFGFNGSIL